MKTIQVTWVNGKASAKYYYFNDYSIANSKDGILKLTSDTQDEGDVFLSLENVLYVKEMEDDN